MPANGPVAVQREDDPGCAHRDAVQAITATGLNRRPAHTDTASTRNDSGWAVPWPNTRA